MSSAHTTGQNDSKNLCIKWSSKQP